MFEPPSKPPHSRRWGHSGGPVANERTGAGFGCAIPLFSARWTRIGDDPPEMNRHPAWARFLGA